MTSITSIGYLRPLDETWELYHVLEGQEIVVLMRPDSKTLRWGTPMERGHEICRLGWAGHLHRGKEPVHESVLDMIGRSLVALCRQSHAEGYAKAMGDVRRLIGVKEPR